MSLHAARSPLVPLSPGDGQRRRQPRASSAARGTKLFGPATSASPEAPSDTLGLFGDPQGLLGQIASHCDPPAEASALAPPPGKLIGAIIKPLRQSTPRGDELERLLKEAANHPAAVTAVAVILKRRHETPAARQSSTILQEQCREFSLGMAGTQAIACCARQPLQAAELVEEDERGASATVWADAQTRLLSVDLLVRDTAGLVQESTHMVPRLYAIIVHGQCTGEIEMEWLDADCAFGLFMLRRSVIGCMNQQTEAENAVGLAPGRGPSGERHRSRTFRWDVGRVLGDVYDHPTEERHVYLAVNLSLPLRRGDNDSVNYTRLVEVTNFVWDRDVNPLERNDAAGLAAREAPLGRFLAGIAHETRYYNRLVVRGEARNRGAAEELAWKRMVSALRGLANGDSSITGCGRAVFLGCPLAAAVRAPDGTLDVALRDNAHADRQPTLPEQHLSAAAELWRSAIPAAALAPAAPALRKTTTRELWSLVLAWRRWSAKLAAAQKALETREAWVREASPELSGEAQADLQALGDESAEEADFAKARMMALHTELVQRSGSTTRCSVHASIAGCDLKECALRFEHCECDPPKVRTLCELHGGGSLCECDPPKKRSRCALHGGGELCECNPPKRRTNCELHGGSALCECVPPKERTRCSLHGGGSLCKGCLPEEAQTAPPGPPRAMPYAQLAANLCIN